MSIAAKIGCTAAVELRLGKICGRLAKDLIGLPEFPVLTLQRLQTFGDFGRFKP
jgi:hypothetical protein